VPNQSWNAERLRDASSYWRSCILITAAHFDLFSWIGHQPTNPQALTAHFGGTPDGWEIFVDALCAIGLLRKRGDRYSNTPFSARYLSGGGGVSLLPDFDAWKTWDGLASALLTGKRPAVQRPFASDRRKADRLLMALHRDAHEIAPYLIEKLPLSRARTLLDVGGGLGAYSMAFCRRYPRLRSVLIEHPNVLPLVRRTVRKAGMENKVRVVGLDFTRAPLPEGFDAVLLSNVLHSQGVKECKSLLLKLHRCLNSRGQLILRDVFMSRDRTAPKWGTLFSVSLLLHTPQGRCYTLEEIIRWLREAGFSRTTRPFRSSPLFFDPDSVLIAEKH
jgi:ubiquinone/menaquinone biosynthesis C-methylase UbiE